MFFFFYQKTAYEMRISDWISDVCSSALLGQIAVILPPIGTDRAVGLDHADPHRPVERDVRPQRDIVIANRIGGVTRFGGVELAGRIVLGLTGRQAVQRAKFVAPVRKRAVWGKSVSVRVALGARRINKKKHRNLHNGYTVQYDKQYSISSKGSKR